MHPVDRAMVIQSLVEHLNGATGMYQVEYRAITREKYIDGSLYGAAS